MAITTVPEISLSSFRISTKTGSVLFLLIHQTYFIPFSQIGLQKLQLDNLVCFAFILLKFSNLFYTQTTVSLPFSAHTSFLHPSTTQKM